MESKGGRGNKEKLGIFRRLFAGLPQAYGTYDPSSGSAWTVKEPVTDQVLHAHLTGRRPYGVFLLVEDRTRAIAVDFDTQDTFLPASFVDRAGHYEILSYIERSKSKGYHVWIFFEDKGVLALKARRVVSHILDEIDAPKTEVFPQHDAVNAHVPFGNFVNAPLFGALAPRGKTIFVDPPHFEPYPDQWAFLESVVRHSEPDLDRIIEMNDIALDPRDEPPKEAHGEGDRTPFSLPPCLQKICLFGVSEYQRVSCFRLAVQFRRLGLPYDMAVAALKTWALKNRPENGRGVIREEEILSQTTYAYQHDYRGYGCESAAMRTFCDPVCPVAAYRAQSKRALSPETGQEEIHGRILNRE